jgi:hypothetical protein
MLLKAALWASSWSRSLAFASRSRLLRARFFVFFLRRSSALSFSARAFSSSAASICSSRSLV